MGNGSSDAQLDILLHQNNVETLLQIQCRLDNYMVESAHDLIVSQCLLLSYVKLYIPSELITAPKVENERFKII